METETDIETRAHIIYFWEKCCIVLNVFINSYRRNEKIIAGGN